MVQKNSRGNNHGQITVFIIVGIVILLLAGFLFYLTAQIQEKRGTITHQEPRQSKDDTTIAADIQTMPDQQKEGVLFYA